MSISYILDAPVALSLLVITVGLSIWGFKEENFLDKHLLIPYDMLAYKEYWRIITSGFIHGNALHLTMNMVTFYFFAFMLEHRLGHWQFGVLYFLGLFLSNVAVSLKHMKNPSFEGSLGASGAISALVLSAVICNPFLKFGFPIISEMWPILYIPGYILATIYVLYSFINSLRNKEMRVNHDAHLWGALAGIALTFALKPSVVRTLEAFAQMW
ncbi:MAG: rhomboid family intramembrane serine protease [Bacteroidota bacterium]